jgi:hypothetical protein
VHDISFTFTSELRKSPGEGAWYFINLPAEHTAEIKFFAHDAKRGFGSVRVTATIGETEWKTSVFPSKELGAYILPVKAEIRKKNALKDGSIAEVQIDIVV